MFSDFAGCTFWPKNWTNGEAPYLDPTPGSNSRSLPPPTSLTSRSSSGKLMFETLALASAISKAAGVLGWSKGGCCGRQRPGNKCENLRETYENLGKRCEKLGKTLETPEKNWKWMQKWMKHAKDVWGSSESSKMFREEVPATVISHF